MAKPIVHGPTYSTYTRTVRLALEEKPAEYELAEVDILAGQAQGPVHLKRQPFGKVPAFEHDGTTIYETGAIVRYIDQVFPGIPLTPQDPRRAARMNQVIGIVDSYAYGAVLGKIVWQRLIVPMNGGQPDEAVVAEAGPITARCLAEFERLLGGDPFLAGPEISLADLFLAPNFAYFMMTPDSRDLLAPHPGLQAWWKAMSHRPSMAATEPKLG